MKIYFAGSITGGREHADIYKSIIALLKSHGTVLTEHVASSVISEKGEHTLTPEFIYDRDVAWLKESDIVVAEVTMPSLGVGYELGYAESLGKKIICLYRQGGTKTLSNMISGNKNFKTFVYNNPEDLPEIFDNHLK